MARVTIEDCRQKIPNKYELVVVAGERALDLSSGAHKTIADKDKHSLEDKNTVTALQEIAAGTIMPDFYREKIINKYCKSNHSIKFEEESTEDLSSDEENFTYVNDLNIYSSEDGLSEYDENESDDQNKSEN